jgi:hypothetical protein
MDVNDMGGITRLKDPWKLDKEPTLCDLCKAGEDDCACCILGSQYEAVRACLICKHYFEYNSFGCWDCELLLSSPLTSMTPLEFYCGHFELDADAPPAPNATIKKFLEASPADAAFMSIGLDKLYETKAAPNDVQEEDEDHDPKNGDDLDSDKLFDPEWVHNR